MTVFNLNFDLTAVNPSGSGGGCLPVSDSNGHLVQIVSSEMKSTKDGNGGMLVFEIEGMDGEAVGSSATFRLNLFNPSEKAVQIARADLAAICAVIGVAPAPGNVDTSIFHGRPFRAVVVADSFTNTNGETVNTTKIKRFLDANGNKPGKCGAPAVQSGPPAQQFAASSVQSAFAASAPPTTPAPVGNVPPWAAR